MQKFLVPVLALVLLVAGVYFVFEFQLGKRSDAGGAPPTAVVTRGDVEQVVDVSGDITPRTEVEIKSEISGRIMRILVSEGESVQQGQLLVELDDRDLLDEMASTQTDISSHGCSTRKPGGIMSGQNHSANEICSPSSSIRTLRRRISLRRKVCCVPSSG